MAKYSKKPVVIEAFTFEEFLKEGLRNATSVVDGVPWSFSFRGHACTHERDDLYLIPTLEGVHNMTPADVVIVGVRGEIYPCKIDIFHETYELVEESQCTTGQDGVERHKVAGIFASILAQKD